MEAAACNATDIIEMAAAYLGTCLANAMDFCEGAYYFLQDGRCFRGC
jgi:hypothetical protein